MLKLTAADRDRVLEIAYDVRYGTINPPVIRLRSGASVEVAVSTDGKAIRLTRVGGPQHGKMTRLAFDPGARLSIGTKRPAGRKTATRRKVANPSGLVVRAGDRVEMHPASPRWKAGDKFCVVTGVSDAGIDVEFDLSGDIRRIQPMSIGRVNGAVVDGVVYPTPKGKRRKVTNPSRETPYAAGVRVGFGNAEEFADAFDRGDAPDDYDGPADRGEYIRESAEVTSMDSDESRFYGNAGLHRSDPDRRPAIERDRFKAGVRAGIKRYLAAQAPKRNPARRAMSSYARSAG